MSITISYGVESATLNRALTAGQIKEDEDLRSMFGWGDNINVIKDGVTLQDHVQIPDGARVVVETAANTKATCASLQRASVS